MKLLYTNSPSYNTPQTVPNNSIGGYVSSTEVFNDSLNNIFSELSELSKQTLKRETFLIAVKNDSLFLASNILLSFDINFLISICEYEMSIVSSQTDTCGNIYFEKLNNSSNKPIHITNTEKIIASNFEFILPDMQSDEIIGIWLTRNLIKNNIKALSCDELASNYSNNIEVNNEENFFIDLEWSENDPSNSNSDSNSSSNSSSSS